MLNNQTHTDMLSNKWDNSTIYDRSKMDMSRLFKGVSVEDGFTEVEVREIEKEAIALMNIGWNTKMAVKRAIDGSILARTYYCKVAHMQREWKN